MQINDLEHTPPTIDPTPRPYARSTRRVQHEQSSDAPVMRLTGYHVLAIAISGCVLAGLVILISSFGGSRPIPTQPTSAPASVFTPPTPVPTRVPTLEPTIAPTAAPAPTPPPAVEPPPQTGQGLTLMQDVVLPEAAPSYVENVGAQAEHSPRGGLCGPTGGDCAPGVPFGIDSSQYIANVGAQSPHKVR